MSRPFIHLSKSSLNSPFLSLSGGDFHHLIKVLRCRRGDVVALSNGFFTAEGEIIKVSDKEARLRIYNKKKIVRQGSTIALFFSPLKGKRMDFLLEKATELGVDEFHPVFFKRTVSRPDEINARDRWGKIIKAAAEQSRQVVLPRLFPVKNWGEVLSAIGSYSRVLVFLEDEENNSLRDFRFRDNEKIAVIVGPEGGFSEEEKESFRASGFDSLTLGRQVLRAETASLVALTLVSYLLGRLS